LAEYKKGKSAWQKDSQVWRADVSLPTGLISQDSQFFVHSARKHTSHFLPVVRYTKLSLSWNFIFLRNYFFEILFRRISFFFKKNKKPDDTAAYFEGYIDPSAETNQPSEGACFNNQPSRSKNIKIK